MRKAPQRDGAVGARAGGRKAAAEVVDRERADGRRGPYDLDAIEEGLVLIVTAAFVVVVVALPCVVVVAAAPAELELAGGS